MTTEAVVTTRQDILRALGLPAILLVALLLSWPALTGPFLFDDFPNLEQLASLNGHLDWRSLANFASLYGNEPGRPLSMLSFVINDYAWPSDPWGFKYTNLMLHLLVGVVVFGTSRSIAKAAGTASKRADAIALLTSAAWLLHPMQLSTSMLVVQRMTQLSALFSLLGIWGYVALAGRTLHPASAVAAIGVLGAGTIFAALSKETGALTPLLAVVLNATLLRQRLSSTGRRSRWILHTGTALPVLVLLAAVAVKFDSLTGYSKRPFNLEERLLTECRVLFDYVFNILVPNLRGGGIYHDDFVASRGLLTPWTTLPAVLGVCTALLAALLTHRRWPLVAFGVLWFLCGHLLESTVFPLELYFEHRNYLPMFGILFAISTAILSSEGQARKWFIALAWCWVAFAAWLTSVQAPIWGNRDALVSVWAIEHPDSPRAVQEKAAYYYRVGNNSAAAATLLDGYKRGVRGSDFPVQVLLLACQTHDPLLAKNAEPFIRTSLATDVYSKATAVTLRKFRRAVQGDECPDILTDDGWLALTDLVLSNSMYANGSAASYIRVERSYLYRHRRDLDSTMRELEAAWNAHPTPALARLAAATLASAGLYQDASEWAELALSHRVRGIRGWFSQEDLLSRKLLDALRRAQSSQIQPDRE